MSSDAGAGAGASAAARAREAPAGAWVGRWAPVVALALIVGVAFAVRVAPARSLVLSGAPEAAADGGVRLFDTDSYYHLRHARFAAAHFPRLERWDPGIYPDGLQAIYVGLFDVVIGGVALIAGGGHPDDATVARAAAWTPPVLGALAFVALYALATAVSARRAAGALAALLLLLYPGTFLHRSLLGAADHHVAEVLLGLLTALGLARALGTARDPRTARRPWWRPDALAALPLGAFLFTWYGAPIYLVLVAVAFFVVVTVDVARGARAAAVGDAAFRYGLGLIVVVVPVSLVAPWLVMDRDYFRKALLAAGALATGLPIYARAADAAVARARRWRPEGRAGCVIVALAGAALVAIAALVGTRVVPGAAGLVDQLVGVKTALVKEQADVSLGMFAFLGGAPAFLAVLALPLGLVDAWRDRDGGRDHTARLGVIVLASLVVALWVRTHDYGYAAPPFLALLAADVLARAWRAVASRRLRVAGALAAGALVILPVWPAAAVAPVVPDLVTMRGFMILRPGWEQALGWLRTETPALARPLEATWSAPGRHPPGNYGVLAFWDFGHYVAAIGRRPPLVVGGISGSIARWFLLDDEDEAVRELARAAGRRVKPTGLPSGAPGDTEIRYCIVDAQTAGDFFVASMDMAGAAVSDYVQIFTTSAPAPRRLMRFGPRYQAAMVARLYENDGDGLAHFRLVYASPERSFLAYHAPRSEDRAITRTATVIADADEESRLRATFIAPGAPVVGPDEIVYEGIIAPSVKVFEQVAGAHLTGAGTPGTIVEARLALEARAGGQAIRYHRAGTVDAAGRFDIVVPYPTEPAPPGTDVVAHRPYDLRDGAGRVFARATVSADAVRAGSTVEVTPNEPAAPP